MRFLAALAISIVCLSLCACVSAPKQTVELADVVSQQIAQMQASHEKFVKLYYDGLRSDVDQFMQDKWTPQFLSNVISGTDPGSKQFRDALDAAYKNVKIDWNTAVKIDPSVDSDQRKAVQDAIDQLASRQRGQLGQVLLDFSTEAQRQINMKRQSLLKPIDDQETYVLDQLRDGYAELQAGSATIKAYLASVVNVTEKRDEILQRLGVLDTQKKMLATAEQVNDQAISALSFAKSAEAGVNDFISKLKSLQDSFKQK
jgi:hypothetical protein